MKMISRDSGEPPWMQLRDALREAILSGELTGRLPSAGRIGAEQDGMAANTVSKALRALRDEGLVTSRKGWGWFVVPESERPASPGGGAGRAGALLRLVAQVEDDARITAGQDVGLQLRCRGNLDLRAAALAACLHAAQQPAGNGFDILAAVQLIGY
jgi:DNA-binding FadR family transcriptional regulator